jgi:peptide/nickel transport system permease protein
MLTFLIRRLFFVIPTLLGVAILVFFLIRVMPGDVVVVKLRADGAPVTEETIEAERKRLGLDKPLYEQFREYMVGLAHGDLGKSLWTDQPVLQEIAIRFPVSLQVALMATIIAILISVPLGTVSAIYRDTWIDYTVRIFAVAGLAVPSFWLGMLLILGLLSLFNWLPKIGYVPIWEDPVANLSALIWPALAVGYRYAAVATRMMRSALLEVLREDYIRTAWAKGQNERAVVWRHALKNAILPVVTVIGIEFAFLIGGLVVTETVFNLPGVARYLVDAIQFRDYPIVQNLAMLIAVVVVLANLAVDLLYTWLDPRIKYGSA